MVDARSFPKRKKSNNGQKKKSRKGKGTASTNKKKVSYRLSNFIVTVNICFSPFLSIINYY